MIRTETPIIIILTFIGFPEHISSVTSNHRNVPLLSLIIIMNYFNLRTIPSFVDFFSSPLNTREDYG